MNNRRRKKTNKNIENKHKTVTRCKHKMIPVFESDTCKDFIKKENLEANTNCKNCKHSF